MKIIFNYRFGNVYKYDRFCRHLEISVSHLVRENIFKKDSRLWCLIVSLLLCHWYPGSGVVLDCIHSWSLPCFLLWRTYELGHEISNNVVCATSKCSDQYAHTCRLIGAFASRLNILWMLTVFGVSKLKKRLHRFVWVYTCQNTTLLEVTFRGSIIPKVLSLYLEVHCV